MGLPADDLCLENAVVLERFSHRFPLVVDPAGQATRFLLNKYKVPHPSSLSSIVESCFFDSLYRFRTDSNMSIIQQVPLNPH